MLFSKNNIMIVINSIFMTDVFSKGKAVHPQSQPLPTFVRLERWPFSLCIIDTTALYSHGSLTQIHHYTNFIGELIINKKEKHCMMATVCL